MTVIERIIYILAGLLIVYFLIDAFFLNSGLVDPSIIYRMNQTA